MFQYFGNRSFGGEENSLPINRYEDYFRCYPISMMPKHLNKDKFNYGGKIFLPSSALHKLMSLQIRYPMLFELLNEETHKITHCGVLEFIAEEGRAYIPNWMMESLKLTAGGLLKINNTDLPLGTFVKIEPQSIDFIEDICDPKAILETQLRNFATLTVDDIIEIEYMDKIFRIKVLEVKPDEEIEYNGGICIIETDLVTDFAPPKGYAESYDKVKKNKDENKLQSKTKVLNIEGRMRKQINYDKLLLQNEKEKNNRLFEGKGNRVSGRISTLDDHSIIEKLKISNDDQNDSKSHTSNDEKIKNMIKNNENLLPLRLPANQLFFGFPVILPSLNKSEEIGEKEIENSKFQGVGSSLRSTKRKIKESSGVGVSQKNTKKSKITSGTIDDPMQID